MLKRKVKARFGKHPLVLWSEYGLSPMKLMLEFDSPREAGTKRVESESDYIGRAFGR